MTNEPVSIPELLTEYDRALAYTESLWSGLTDDQWRWRPNEDSSAIGWHLGHQAAVAHFLVRNLIAAGPSPDPALDSIFDSAAALAERGDLPDRERLRAFRTDVAECVRARLGAIESGHVGAPEQLRVIGAGVLTAIVNHEYQHDQWIGEVRAGEFGLALPARPVSGRLTVIDGYTVLSA